MLHYSTALSVVAAGLPASALLLAMLLVIGFGSLGQFPIYYAFTQELSARRMGNVTGALSFLTWTVHALVQEPIGRWLDRTHRYGAGHVPGRADAAASGCWPSFCSGIRGGGEFAAFIDRIVMMRHLTLRRCLAQCS